ncbi:hypothetical protein [Pseudosulfitobacter sp. DSM 107133]|uniref:hypothetical protein n=1 Tax=Pseudosulfitobacter sp. DSM 107133 TaxID=2883100 RepID=UPI000DF43240|nr:hypothetical protein [Pseudosulfitobacter sp. DSM 107133]UOA28753.1 hypothetical protein DSM107133_03511 [Pseudosulfitobacter sp. DSM 107133]
MDRRNSRASATDTQRKLRHDERTPFLTILAIGVAGAAMVAGLVMLLFSQGAIDDNAAMASGTVQDWTPDVSRADASLLDPEPAVSTARRLRTMTNATGQPVDLSRLTERVLHRFGYTPRSGKALQAALLSALSQEQSDAYIDTLLNMAARRKEFVVPGQLRLANGRLDTETLLATLIDYASD